MEEEFKRNINKMVGPQEKILAAVSGGVDSIVMLHLLVKTIGKERIEVAHCNFRLRPGEADTETQLVEESCKKLGVECNTTYFNTKEFAAQNKLSTQEAARKLRYDFFDQTLASKHLDKISIAHNQNDTIETFFVNLLRGTGLRGLRGIAIERDSIIRPLMFASRARIEEYAIKNGIKWLNDSSNSSDDYLRNNLRHNVIPALENCREGASTMISENMERIKAHYNFEQQVIEQLRGDLFEGNRMNIAKFLECPMGGQFLLFSLLGNAGFSWEVAEDILKSINSNDSQGKIFFSTNHRALIDRGWLIIEPLAESPDSELIEIDDSRILIIERTEVTNYGSDLQSAYFDRSKLEFPLIMRSWQSGDRFVPFGMSGSKKVSDLFTDMKVGRFDKERVRVITSGSDIIWVVGLRTDNRFRITANTTQIAKISL